MTHRSTFRLAIELVQLVFGEDGDAVRIEAPGNGSGVGPVVDMGDLLGGESDDLDPLVLPVQGVENVKILPGGAENQNACTRHGSNLIGSSLAGTPFPMVPKRLTPDRDRECDR